MKAERDQLRLELAATEETLVKQAETLRKRAENTDGKWHAYWLRELEAVQRCIKALS